MVYNITHIQEVCVDKQSQVVRLYQLLQTGRKITGIEALAEIGTMKLSTRVGELEKEYGVTVNKQMIKVPSGKRVMQYWL